MLGSSSLLLSYPHKNKNSKEIKRYKQTKQTNIPTIYSTMSPQGQKAELENIRFNKFFDKKDVLSMNKFLPLKADDYPLVKQEKDGEKEKDDVVDFLKNKTKGDSIVVPSDVQLKSDSDKNVNNWEVDNLTDAKISPIYPGDNHFWGEFRDVVQNQLDRRNEESPNDKEWPQSWKKYSYEQIAEEVNGEYPASIQQDFLEKVYKGKDENKDKKNRAGNGKVSILELGQPFRSKVDFIGLQVRMAAINTWTFEAVAPVNFMLKWHYGMPRPEEIAWKIKEDVLTTEKHGVPKDLVNCIKDMELESASDFTAYETGSPTHPSFPAMHSAGSTVSLWLPALYDISLDQYYEALLIDRGVAFGRTVAGVHYRQDNIAGLNIGQRIIREKLPGFLADRYGYDETKVSDRLKAFSFDWNKLEIKDKKDITIYGESVKDFFEKRCDVALDLDSAKKK